MSQISQLRPGQAVKFFRSHDKQTALTGTIVAVQKNGNMVRVKTDPAGGSVSRIEEAHCDDVTVLGGNGSAVAAGAKAEWDEAKANNGPAAEPDKTA